MKLLNSIADLEAEMRAWRHHLHAHPETAFQEHQTAAFIAQKLSSFDLDVKQGIGGTGVVGTLKGTVVDSKVIGLRADMDSLDIQEENDLKYRSTVPGKMHACGHDGHMAMLLGAAKYLADNPAFKGVVRFIFQPAEENEGGGRAMLEDGLFEMLPFDAVFGLHNIPLLKEGSFAIRTGPIMAAFDIFDITIKGSGGHAAMPHTTHDPVMAAAQAISMFQSIVSRNTDPIEGSVISVTEIKGGNTYNVIPDIVSMRGTTRHFQPHIQDIIESRIKEILKGLETSMGVTTVIKYERRYPAVINTTKETEEAIRATVMLVGDDNVFTNLAPIMGSEDFSFMLKARPGTFMIIGAGMPRTNGMLHCSGFDFNDKILTTGASYWINLVQSLLV
ncbi:MAG: amidohydrolase [Deltaproteobacteria bacterium]|nr:amidohydrolase [Deltaproteobacteria bacterium]